jgi:hypothetical protein
MKKIKMSYLYPYKFIYPNHPIAHGAGNPGPYHYPSALDHHLTFLFIGAGGPLAPLIFPINK